MSGMDNSDRSPHHAPNFRAIRWHWDWVTRPLFALVLGGVAIIALFKSPFYFALWCAIGAIPAAREWHRMVGDKRYPTQAAFTAFVVVFAIFGLLLTHNHPVFGFEVLAAGTLAAILLARLRGMNPAWQAAAIPYLGIPLLALVALRAYPVNVDPLIFPAYGAFAVIGLFIIVWATDIGALSFGNLIGGPRLVPVLSPNKTWAGTIGGMITAVIAFALYVHYLGGNAIFAGLAAVVLSVTAHGGDLFESWVKRRFKVKNSGSLIPGHGGVLDRVDSLLSASAAMAILVFVFHLDPLFGAHSPLFEVRL
ncbi:MAG TPA: phosphatidate cytidylyltransferase [Rhizomicrobium sp.]